MIHENRDEAVGFDRGSEPRVMDALRTLRACGLLLVATVLLAVLAACDSPGPDGADGG